VCIVVVQVGLLRSGFGYEESDSVAHSRRGLRRQRLAHQFRNDLPHACAALGGELPGSVEEIVVELQGGSHIEERRYRPCASRSAVTRPSVV